MCYDLLANNFQKKGLLLSTAETHGMMLGYLSTAEDACFKTWTLLVDDLLLWNELDEAIQDQLAKLFLSSHMELVQHVLDLTLAIPSHEQSFLSRLSATSDWCRGYLYGIGLSTPPGCLFDDHDIQELLNDITQFSQVAIEVEPTTDGQTALNEITSHIQQSVQIIYTKCHKQYITE
jgi:uncharacterized protein YgfB (UPF0149 family)